MAETSLRMEARLRAAQSCANRHRAQLQQAQKEMQDCVAVKVFLLLDAMLAWICIVKQNQHVQPT